MTRICLSPPEVRALQHDGLGWGHDLDAGCLQVEDLARQPSRPLRDRITALLAWRRTR